jgi:CheY-like chemotaxis protein
VTLRTDLPRQAAILVHDDGKGLTSDDLQLDTDDPHGFGLYSVRERLLALGGGFRIDSSPQQGTTFILEVPLKGNEKPRPAIEEAPTADHACRLRKDGDGEALRVLVVDDHRMFREGLRVLAEHQEGIEWIGQAADGFEALERIDELRPDVVLMDIDMPRMNGIEATRQVKTKHPEILVLGLSFHEEPETAEAMCRAGATACVKKGGDADTLFATIRELYFRPVS